VDWISPDQYARLPASWSVEDERRVFGAAGGGKANKDGPSVRDDDRFRSSDAHEKLLQAAEDAEREAEMEDADGEGGSEDDDDDEPPAPGKSSGGAGGSRPGGARPELPRDANQPPTSGGSGDDSSSSSDDSSSSPESSDDEDTPAEKLVRENIGSGETPAAAARGKEGNSEGGGNDDAGGDDDCDDDDFFVEASGEEGATNPFAGAPRIKGLDEIRGDKSQGWATQRQRPGEYKSDGRRRPRPAGHRGWKKDNKRR
jgi:hypothetical protein